MNEAPRPVRAGYGVRLLASTLQPKLVRLALVMVLAAVLSACAGVGLPGSHPASSARSCADKVVKSVTANQSVGGLWNCLDSTLQQNLLSTTNQTGDAVLTDPTLGPPPIISTQYVGSANGVFIYTAVVKPNSGGVYTVTITIWVDTNGKVSNIGLDAGIF